MLNGLRKPLFLLFRSGLILAICAAAVGWASPAASCPTCFTESGTAYNFCYFHPGEDYYGCNFVVHCGDNTSSATQIYRNNCQL
jgi:hypothetical protein